MTDDPFPTGPRRPAPLPPSPSPPASAPPPGPPRSTVRSSLSDGQWHRMHPLTPLLRGGLFLLVIIGILVANLRDRLFTLIFPWLVPDLPEGRSWEEYDEDPVDFVVANNLVVVAIVAVLAVLVLVLAWAYVSWRFHTFRITGDDVEVRSGILFRTHRRAPLDRVQGVNLTRPMVARLLGMAKLEVVGAGTDANVKLEYLSTTNAETVRGDILRLASGRRLGAAAAADAGLRGAAAAAATVGAGIAGLLDGVDTEDDEPESVVEIPPGRVMLSHLLSSSGVALVAIVVAIVVGSSFGQPWVLLSAIPTLLGFGAYWMRSITRSLRYSIAPTPSGVRITSGLFTTITETLPPGRVHAVEVQQHILWRPADWWSIRVNRLSGRSSGDGDGQAQSTVLPVGAPADVERVLRLLLPGVPAHEWPDVFRHGIRGPVDGDPYTNTPRRGRWLRPLSWRRNGVLLTPDALFLRRGLLRRSLVVLPLARLQSVRIAQGPLARTLDLASVRGHTVLGPVPGALGALDRAATMRVWSDAAAGAIAAAAGDRSHRWASEPGPGAPLSEDDARPDDPASGAADTPDDPASDAGRPV
ncbi:PH domain-containing protein [Microbacterium sp.]|uniref:PH domain-containing protein n=1 Tax=Microbacterium sp. TaxID=51671 RepID=UPI0039E63B7F